MTRLGREAWAMEMAQVTARRSTCLRRHVGCVLVDKDFYVLATGYNGVAAGQPHCNKRVNGAWALGNLDVGVRADRIIYANHCPGAFAASGTNLDGCHAIHAEQNALLRLRDPRELYACFCTASPCMTCTKLLMNTGCQVIIFGEAYPHNEAQLLWESMGREWRQFSADS